MKQRRSDEATEPRRDKTTRPPSLRRSVASSLSSKAKGLLKKVRAMFQRDDPYAPLKAPWPPGINVRRVVSPTGGPLYQLRPGAMLPHNLYVALARKVLERASKQSARPCAN